MKYTYKQIWLINLPIYDFMDITICVIHFGLVAICGWFI